MALTVFVACPRLAMTIEVILTQNRMNDWSTILGNTEIWSEIRKILTLNVTKFVISFL